MAKKNTRREFSYTRPILIGENTYPSTDSIIIDENGNKTKGKIFTDANGQYYTIDGNNNISPVMISKPLDAATAVPFAVASYPFIGGAAEYMGGTALGQGLTRGLGYLSGAASNSTWLPWADAALTSYFGANGMQDIQNGRFTPETAMDFMWLYPASRSFTGLMKQKNTTKNLEDVLHYNSFSEGETLFNSFKQDPLEMHYARAKAKGYDPSSIQIYNLAENSEENTKLINDLAQQYGLTPEQTLDFLMNQLDTHGHAAAFSGTNNIIHDGKATNLSAILSHEVDHVLHTPSEPLPEDVFYPRIKNIYGDYFTKRNNTEVSARGSQLHDYFGHTGTEPLTVEDLEYAKKHYVQDTGINNEMHDLLWCTKDLEPLAKWMSKYSTGVIPIGIINNNQQKTIE